MRRRIVADMVRYQVYSVGGSNGTWEEEIQRCGGMAVVKLHKHARLAVCY